MNLKLRKMLKKNYIIALLSFLAVSAGLYYYKLNKYNKQTNKLKLYWFIPDGLRAEPDLFKIFEWAEQGKLPHLKTLISRGAFGYSKPVFPTHTPVNFATLLTGTVPEFHGVADGPMHTENNELSKISVSGFSSVARKIPAVWSYIESAGFKSALISVPGSTPPEITNGIVIRGRWGGWGKDITAVNFELKNQKRVLSQGHASRLFYFGPQLTRFVSWSEHSLSYPSYSPIKKFKMTVWGQTFYGAVIDESNDNIINYDKIIFSRGAKKNDAVLKQGEWSSWFDVKLNLQDITINSSVKFHTIILKPDGFFRVRLLFNNLNRTVVFPSSIFDPLNKALGPMVDFVDNFPPQLIYFKQDKQTFLDELNFSFDYHSSLIPHVVKERQVEFVIHNIYSPNQMLTSRWWLGAVDPHSSHYSKTSVKERNEAWEDILAMYKRVDDMIGYILKTADENTLIVLSSDHGAAPLNSWVYLNNLFAREGLLKFKKDEKSQLNVIDWKNTKAIYLKMDGVFIHPKGFDGPWKRSSGQEYEQLRDKVISLLNNIKNEKGEKIVTKIVRWESVDKIFKLPKDRVGDLIIANKSGYGWNETVSEDLKLFSTPLKQGYKQAILTDSTNAMWTPFVIAGPNIKNNYKIKKLIQHDDQLPTILKALGIDLKVKNITGSTVNEIFN